MNTQERQKFWNTLISIDGKDHQKDFKKVMSTINHPQELCRYRSVNPQSLNALRNNILYFSSASYYDDPFDSYLKINWNEIENQVKENFLRIKSLPVHELQKFLLSFHIHLSVEEIQYRINTNNELELFNNIKGILKLLIRPLLQQNSFSICFSEFSEDDFNQNLWLKYADNYKGFCLVYDLNFLTNKNQEANHLYIQNSFINNIFPIYYSIEPYDGTKYALAILKNFLYISGAFNLNTEQTLSLQANLKQEARYEQDKISLIKDICHERDKEWRMLRYAEHYMHSPYIIWQPSKVIIGLKTPNKHKIRIIHAAQNAGVKNIYQMIIDDRNKLKLEKLLW